MPEETNKKESTNATEKRKTGKSARCGGSCDQDPGQETTDFRTGRNAGFHG